jgi:predicted permease
MTPRPLSLALAWIRLCAPLAPACLRGTWRAQWRADLWHYWSWLVGEPISRRSAAMRLLGRAWGALPHAWSLRVNTWSLRMLLHDLRFAWRMILRRPAFTAVAILILGLGIGANATIFSWVEAVLLRPLPGVPDQDRLVSLRGTTPGRADLSFSYLNFRDLRGAKPDGFEDLIAFRPAAMNLRTNGEPVRVWGELVTSNFFEVLRIRPVHGRAFLPSDDSAPDKEAVVVLGHNVWQRLFRGDVSVIGRSITLNGRPFTVVGIAPAGFAGSAAGLSLDVFVPITMQKAIMSGDRLPQRGNSFLQVFGRLADGASLERARASAAVVAGRLVADHPEINADRGIRVIPLHQDGASGLMMPVMATLMGVVAIVLLVACANLAGLLLAKAAGRQREVAVRLAVGASRGRLIRQFLVESALLAAAGGAAGIVMSYWTSGLLTAFVPRTPFPVGFAPAFSPTLVGFSIAATAATAIAFGLLPAFRISRPDVVDALKASSGSMSFTFSRGSLRQVLVVGQVALSLLLLVCAALFTRSLTRAQQMDPGFSTRSALVASLDVLPNGYDAERGIVFYQQLLQRLNEVPGVDTASVATILPLDISSGSDMQVDIEGYTPRKGEELHVYYNRVGPLYFDTMGISIVQGRAIDASDVEGRQQVAVINETMARRYWAGRDPVGGLVEFGDGPTRIVGVARDGKYSRYNEPAKNYMYLPTFQYYRPDVALIVKAAGGDPASLLPAVQREIRALDANLPLFDVRTLDEHLQFSLFIPRMASQLLGLFGALSLLLAAVGLYSVIAFSVAQRRREIGIRMALGADRRDVLRLVARQGFVIITAGIAVGLGLALAASRLLADQLPGVSSSDPISYVATACLLAVVAILACLIPARTAASLDPLLALRRD